MPTIYDVFLAGIMTLLVAIAVFILIWALALISKLPIIQKIGKMLEKLFQKIKIAVSKILKLIFKVGIIFTVIIFMGGMAYVDTTDIAGLFINILLLGVIFGFVMYATSLDFKNKKEN